MLAGAFESVGRVPAPVRPEPVEGLAEKYSAAAPMDGQAIQQIGIQKYPYRENAARQPARRVQ